MITLSIGVEADLEKIVVRPPASRREINRAGLESGPTLRLL
jgi:hypothetical protein